MSDDVVHPSWCDPAECTYFDHGEHRSAVARWVDPDGAGTEVVVEQAHGIAGYPASGAPKVVLTVAVPVFDPEDVAAGLAAPHVLVFPPDWARALGRQLLAAGRIAGGDA